MIKIKHVFGYLKPYYLKMFFGLIIKFVGTIMDLMIPWLLAIMIDDIVPTGNVKKIFLFGALMVLCSIVAIVGNIIANQMASRVAKNTTGQIRFELYSKIMKLSTRQTDEITVPSLESRLTSDTYNVHQMLGMIQRLGVRAPILLIGGITVTVVMEPVLTLVLVALLPFITMIVYKISKSGIPLYVSLQGAVDKMVRVVRENAQGIRIIKALSTEEREKKRFREVNENVVASEKKAAFKMAVTNPLINLFLNLGLTAVILVGAVRVNAGLTEPGKIIAFMTYFTLILNAMLSITRMFVNLSRGTASAKRISEILDMPLEDTESEIAASDKSDAYKSGSAPHIEFDNVSFSYKGVKNNVEDISFSLEHGQTLGIIGATGSGKSTLIWLLLRFYNLDSGVIRIDGRDIRGMNPSELRRKFGLALQSDFLFMDTISENISFGRGLSESEIEDAASVAQASDFIKEYDDGFMHELTIKGSNLSGGQKQRLLIARAVAGDPEILILDDSSSALDYKTDAALRKSVAEKKKADTTSIIIAQRVSSIMHADQIIVLDEGKIAAKGTHDELERTCEIYREICESQLGGGFVE